MTSDQIYDEIKGIRKDLRNHADEDATRHGEIMRELGTWIRGAKETERRVADLEKFDDLSGVNTVTELKAEVKDLREQKKESRRFLRGLMFGAASSTIVGVVVALILHALGMK